MEKREQMKVLGEKWTNDDDDSDGSLKRRHQNRFAAKKCCSETAPKTKGPKRKSVWRAEGRESAPSSRSETHLEKKKNMAPSHPSETQTASLQNGISST